MPQVNISFIERGKMPTSQFLKDFINERLAAAAVEIFGVFERTLVQYEEEIDRQRGLVENKWTPRIKTGGPAELPQQDVCKEEVVLTDEEVSRTRRNLSMEQNEPQPPSIKEELKELCTDEDREQHALKQENEAFMEARTDEETDISDLEQDCYSEQLLSDHSPAEESQNQKGSKKDDSRYSSVTDLKPKMRCCSNDADNSPMSESQCDTDTSKKCIICDFCGKAFRYMYLMKKHQRIHTGEKPFVCNVCGKKFSQLNTLTVHMRSHTGEKPYSCETCGKMFSQSQTVKVHMRIHTGEKPYLCKVCGRRFSDSSTFKRHKTTHTGEKRYSCETCGKCFKRNETLLNHMNTHIGDFSPS